MQVALTEIIGNLTDTSNRTYIYQHKGFSRLRFRFKIFRGYTGAYFKLWLTLLTKKCYYGPFKGEFGHFLGHNLPFLYYLYSKGVRIFYCGMELHSPFLVDDFGKSIIYRFYPLRDFFAEVSPSSNITQPPEDVQKEIDKFVSVARRDFTTPFWNLDNGFYYWYIHRNWIMKKPYMKICHLDKVYGGGKKRCAVIFPRKKGGISSANNGLMWDYMEVAKVVSPYFDKVYITGHPSLSNELTPEGNIEVRLSKDNKIILQTCAESVLIISQHSGVNYLTEYLDCNILLIFKGTLPIKGIPDTLRFRESLGGKHKLNFAFSLDEIHTFVKNFNYQPFHTS